MSCLRTTQQKLIVSTILLFELFDGTKNILSHFQTKIIITSYLNNSIIFIITSNRSRAYPGGSDGGGRSPLGKFYAPQGYQNNDFHLKIRAVFSLISSEKCHITIFARPPATAMKFYYRRATADLFSSSHKIQITNISLIRN